jgi:hypothetical protein
MTAHPPPTAATTVAIRNGRLESIRDVASTVSKRKQRSMPGGAVTARKYRSLVKGSQAARFERRAEMQMLCKSGRVLGGAPRRTLFQKAEAVLQRRDPLHAEIFLEPAKLVSVSSTCKL